MSTFDEAYAAFEAEALARSGGRMALFDAGSALDALAGAAARLAELLSAEFARRFLAHYFGAAEGEDLDKLARDHLGVERPAAAAANVTLTLARPNTDAGNVTVGTSQTFVTDPDAAEDAVEFRPDIEYVMTGLTLDVAVTAVVPGIAGNVADDTITEAQPPLSDSTVTITNAAPATDGADRLGDDAYRDYLLGLVRSMARGTVQALITGARSVAGVAAAYVDESLAGPHFGFVKVLIGDINGAASAALVACTSDEMENWRGAGIRVSVAGGTRTDIPALTVYVRMRRDTFDPGWVTTTAQAAASQSVSDLPQNERLYQERVDAAVYAALGGADDVADVASAPPSGWPVTPAPGTSLRLAPDVVSVVISS
jgi:hypothetical protein